MESFERDVYLIYTERHDLQMAANLWAMLVARGYNVFYAPRTEAPAAAYERQMESHMKGSRLHLILTSSRTRTEVSRLYEKEIKLALELGRLLPVLVDGRRAAGDQPREDLRGYNALFTEDLTLAGVAGKVAAYLGPPSRVSRDSSTEMLESLLWQNTVEHHDRALLVAENADVQVETKLFSRVKKVRGGHVVADVDTVVKKLVAGMDPNGAIHVFFRASYPTAVTVGACLETEARTHPLFIHHFASSAGWSPFVLPVKRFPSIEENTYFAPLERLVDHQQGSGAVLFLAGQWPAEADALGEAARALNLRYVFALRPRQDWQLQSLREARQATAAISTALAEIQRVTGGGGLCVTGSGPVALALHAAFGAHRRVVGPLFSAGRHPASRTYLLTDDLRPTRP